MRLTTGAIPASNSRSRPCMIDSRLMDSKDVSPSLFHQTKKIFGRYLRDAVRSGVCKIQAGKLHCVPCHDTPLTRLKTQFSGCNGQPLFWVCMLALPGIRYRGTLLAINLILPSRRWGQELCTYRRT